MPCPRLYSPANPHIKSTPSATIARERYLPSKFSLKTGKTVGAATIAAIIAIHISKAFQRFEGVVVSKIKPLLNDLFEGTTLQVGIEGK